MTEFSVYSSTFYTSSDYSSSDESSSEEQIKPIIKWVGGKTRIMNKIIDNIPKKFNNYYEPFLGGASVFLNMPYEKKAVINDFNKDVISLYKFIKDKPKELIKMLKNIQKQYNKLPDIDTKKDYFLLKRKKFNKLKNNYNLERAALYVFINKTCFNGKMTVNKEENLTSCFGKHDKINIVDEDNIFNFSNLLSNNVLIKNEDYATIIKEAKKGDFVYLDSPYIPDDKTKWNAQYNIGGGWSYDDFMRYFDTLDELNKKGAYFMMSNSDSKMVRKWLKNKKYRIKHIPIMRTISGSAEGRGIKKEVIVMNY